MQRLFAMSTKPARIFAFHRVFVTVAPDGSRVIEWVLNRGFPIVAGTPYFYVEYAESGGEWERLNPDTPVTNLCTYVDLEHKRCGYAENFYRVVMVIGSEQYNSKPEPELGVWSRHDWLIARDVVRKEYKRLKKYVGSPGYLLRKRRNGVACTECTDFDTEEPVSSVCSICYGTGVIGGYYDAIPYYMDQSGTASQGDVTSPFGYSDNKRRSARGVAYPLVFTYDLWIDADKNKRYVIRQVEGAVSRKGRPLIYTFELRELPGNAIEYSVPLEQDLSDVTGISPDDQESLGWRREIDYTEVY